MLFDTVHIAPAKGIIFMIVGVQIVSMVNVAAYVPKVEVDDVSASIETFSSTYRCSMVTECQRYRRVNNRTVSDHGRQSTQYYCAYSWKKKVYCNTFDPPPPAFDTSIFKKQTCEQRTEGRNGMTKNDEFLYLQGSVIDNDIECNKPSFLWTLFTSDGNRVLCSFILGATIAGLSLVLLMI